MRARVGEVFSTCLTLSVPEIASFAGSCGDANPLHSDPDYAAGTRFGGVIACGPQYASLLMGLAATHFSRAGAMLGLEFTFRFQKPVRPGERLELRWEVVEVTPKASLDGDLVVLDGRITNEAGAVVLAATGKVLATDRL